MSENSLTMPPIAIKLMITSREECGVMMKMMGR
jgi:hypothetical protein